MVVVRQPITLDGGLKAAIRGSDVWSDWNKQGSTWVSVLTVPPLTQGSDPYPSCTPNTSNICFLPEQAVLGGLPPAKHPEQVWVAGVPQKRVLGTPGTGQFALDSARHVILGSNPRAGVEVTTRPRWIITNSDNVTVTGWYMRDAASIYNGVGGVGADGHLHWTLSNSHLSHAAAQAVTLGVGSVVTGNELSGNGQDAIGGWQATGAQITNNHIHDNNPDNLFNVEWDAAGVKVSGTSQLTVTGNEVDHNIGMGLWCDIGCQGATYSNNRVHDNAAAGIMFEIGDGATITNNAVWANGLGWTNWVFPAGILVSPSLNVTVSGNTVAWNRHAITVVDQARSDKLGPTTNVQVTNNTILQHQVSGDYWANFILTWVEESSAGTDMYQAAANNRGNNNRYWIDMPESPSIARYYYEFAFTTLAAAIVDGRGFGPGDHYISTPEAQADLTAAAIPWQ